MIETYKGFVDARGEIRDLLRDVKLDSVTLIHTKKGAIRGNHYHAKTWQWTYIVSGCLRIVTKEVMPDRVASRRPGDMTAGAQRSADAPAATLLVDPPYQAHAWQALEDATVLVFTSGPRSGPGYESDVIRLTGEERLIV